MDEGTPNDEALAERPAFARGISSPTGKCSVSIKVWLPEEIKDLAEARASQAGTTASEIGRDLFFLWLKGETYGEHVAQCRRALLGMEGADAPLKRDLQALRVVDVSQRDRA